MRRFSLSSLAPASAVLVASLLAGNGSLAQTGQPLQLRPPGAIPGVAAPRAAAPVPPRIPLPPPRPAELTSLEPRQPAATVPPASAPAVSVPAVPAPAAPTPAASTPSAQQAVPARPIPSAGPAPAPVQQAAVDLSPKAVLERANASLNAMGMASADFVQVGGNGRRAEGRLYLQKPGKLRFEYKPPATLEIVADGNSVVIRDSKVGTQDLYGIAQTPLKFLLKERLDLARDTKVVDVQSAPDLASVLIEDRATFGGTSRIELFFDARTFALRQWTVVDPQGYQTTVNLRNVDLTHRPDPALFQIDYTKSMPSASPGTSNR